MEFMRYRILSKRQFVIIGVISLTAIIAFVIGKSAPKGSISQESVKSIENIAYIEPESFGLPVRIRILGIDVDALVEPVGLTSEGSMDIPKGPNETAWFNLGPRPGEVGSAVVSGHYGWKNNIPAVFDNLHKLQKGDKIYIEDEAGKTIVFVMRESRVYGENDYAGDVFDSSDGKAHLNLVTCQGVWNRDKKSYSNRFVVFTDREV